MFWDLGKDSYAKVLKVMMRNNIPIPENGVIDKCLSVIAPEIPRWKALGLESSEHEASSKERHQSFDLSRQMNRN